MIRNYKQNEGNEWRWWINQLREAKGNSFNGTHSCYLLIGRRKIINFFCFLDIEISTSIE